MAHVGEELGLGAVGELGPVLLLGVLLREVGELLRLVFQRLLRLALVGDGRHQPLLALHQPLLVALDRGDVGADRDVAAVLGAPLADLEPAPVAELRLEGVDPFIGLVLGPERIADQRLAAAAITSS